MNQFTEYINSLKEGREKMEIALNDYEEAKKRYYETFRPLASGVPDESLLLRLYANCEPTSEYSKNDIFICMSLILYNPTCFFGGHLKKSVAKGIGRVLGVSHNHIYNTRQKVSVWIDLYPDFLRCLEDTFVRVAGSL